jgi:threonyl-tRNA synthetase
MQEKQAFERIEVSRAEALEIFAENKFKAIFFVHMLFHLIVYIYI